MFVSTGPLLFFVTPPAIHKSHQMPQRVLIADDNESIRKFVRTQIEELAGFVVCAMAADGVEAVEMAMALRPDVVILDVLMPGLNGVEVASILKNNLPGAKVILFTLHWDFMSPRMVSVLGVKLVSKMDGFHALRTALQEVSDSKNRGLDEALARIIGDRAFDPIQLDLLTQQVSTPLTRCGSDLKYLWVNESYAKFLKCPVHKIVGRSILDVVGKDAFDLLQRYFDQTLRGKDVSYEAEVQYESAGRRRIAASYKSTFDKSGDCDGWLAYVEDITARPDPS